MIFYLHGLNTYGDDDLHLGPVRVGRLDQHVMRAFQKHRVDATSIEGIGSGSPEEQATHSLAQIEERLTKVPDKRNVALAGNSMGGIVARVVAAHLRERGYQVRTVTWGTPHRGTVAATFAIAMAEQGTGMNRILSRSGYSLNKRVQTFKHYTPEAMAQFNVLYPADESLFTLPCTVSIEETTPLLWPLYAELHGITRAQFLALLTKTALSRSGLGSPDGFRPSDGFIARGSQVFGRELESFELDHFSQIGFTQFQFSRSLRQKAVEEFDRLMRRVIEVSTA